MIFLIFSLYVLLYPLSLFAWEETSNEEIKWDQKKDGILSVEKSFLVQLRRERETGQEERDKR